MSFYYKYFIVVLLFIPKLSHSDSIEKEKEKNEMSITKDCGILDENILKKESNPYMKAFNYHHSEKYKLACIWYREAINQYKNYPSGAASASSSRSDFH